MTAPAAPTTWTLRFTEWRCGHHGQRPDDIPVQSPQQAKAILWAIACAISQPGHARACLFNDTLGFPDIYVSDDHCEFNPERTAMLRPEVILCGDERTSVAIMAAELRAARQDSLDPDLSNARIWDGQEQVETYEVVLTTMPRAEVEKLAAVDDARLDPPPPKFAIPPLFHDGAIVLRRLRERAVSIGASDAVLAQEQQAVYRVDPVIWRRDLRALLGGVSSETIRLWMKSGKLPKPDVQLSLRTTGWKASTLRAAGIPVPSPHDNT